VADPAAKPRPRGGAADPVEPVTLTADQVAALLGVDRQTVYDYAGRGEIPHRRLGRRILFGRQAILAWLNGGKAA